MRDLTPRQAKLLRYVAVYVQEHQYPPTKTEIAEAVGYSDHTTVQSAIESLSRRGLMGFTAHKPRAIYLTLEGHARVVDNGDLNPSTTVVQ